MRASHETDRGAELTAFMREVTPSLMHTAWLLTGDPRRAEDQVRAALVSTCLAWPRLLDEDPLAHARRALLDHRTGAWHHSRHVSPAGPTDPAVDGPGGRVERVDELVRLLRLLPSRQRQVVVLLHGSGLTEQAAADLLDLSVGAVGHAASRGVATLQAKLAATSPTGGRAVTAGHVEEGLEAALAEAPAPPMTVDPDYVLHRSRRATRVRRVSLSGLVAVMALLAVVVALLGPRERSHGGLDL
ncbi:sigma factor-like helix-turn-helix DNA-binding protein, partial [Oryzihumus sp.]|uniref:sigma factor-like helix-turn-helix DNA-binding protein n=1 Tax=Oryzihumus sp. TaxID=1968903 RepID=UPI002ED80708